MLKLSGYENDMLSGKYGEMKRKAMENICRYAKILNAEELCKVTMATVFAGAHNYLKAAGCDEVKANFCAMNMASEKVIDLDSFSPECMTQTCVEPMDAENYRHLWIDGKEHEMNEEYVSYVMRAGAVRSSSCAPYLTGWVPLKGQHFVTTESSNVLLCNSLFGACGNPEGIEASFWAAICGRTPKYGRHLPENRAATCIVRVECSICTPTDWDLLGYAVGAAAPKSSVPVLAGEFRGVNIIKFKQFAASLAAVSDIDMCHVAGVTPEAPTIEAAFGGDRSAMERAPVITVTQSDIDAGRAKFCSGEPGKVGSVNLGCPHYSIYEIRDAAMFLKGKKIAPWVNLHIWTSYPIRELACRCGYTDIVEEAGGRIFAGSCPCYVFEYPETKKRLTGEGLGVVFDSLKLAYCMPPCYSKSIKTYFGEPIKCLAAAVDGYWR